MPTYDVSARFWRDFERLPPEQQVAFLRVGGEFIEDLRRGVHRRGHRLKRVRGHPGVLELTWAPDGRATFERGSDKRPGDPHIIWRRVGRHDIFRDP